MQENLKTAIVTGATQGIGRAIASALLRRGCRVIAIGRSADKMATLAQVESSAGDLLVCEALDIADTDTFAKRLHDWIARFGRISYLVNAAGILVPGRLLDASSASIRSVVETNFLSTLEVTLAVARHMATERAGSIVTIGSIAATTARMGVGSYPASKAAITHAMKCLGLELAEYGVRCNIVSPGSTNTEMQRLFQSTAGSRDGVLNGDPKQFRVGIPLRRLAEPEDICELVLFLLSDGSRHITMENIIVDGGATLGAR
ncbi:MAG: SDR family oxidoreductase [Alphaproteobacteria bacterium]|nr:SDR family oxidoreductase [Alphaproteobacteria bacterium]